MEQFYLANDDVYILYISCITFLLCCNANAFVICAIKNYLLTYLISFLSFANVIREIIRYVNFRFSRYSGCFCQIQ